MPHRLLLKYKLHHVFFWMLVFGTWYYFRFQDYADPGEAMQITLLKVADLALMIYLTNYLLVPRLMYKKKYGLFAASFIAMVLLSSMGKMYLIGQITGRPGMFSLSGNLKERLYDNVLPHFFLVIAGVAIKVLIDYSEMQQRLAEVAKEKAETELNFLKSQINPHFLFNSLNSVYFLIHKENTAARDTLHKFAEMLRYQLYEMGDEKIPIEKEIQYLRDYVDLQHLRKNEQYTVEFNAAPDVTGFLIEPLLLIPFVENAFKHISHHPDQNNYIHIDLRREKDMFMFTIINSYERGIVSMERKGGIGLVNVQRRLELLYPGRFDLVIENTATRFSVNLKLQLR